jgi:uncharacterized protein YpmS
VYPQAIGCRQKRFVFDRRQSRAEPLYSECAGCSGKLRWTYEIAAKNFTAGRSEPSWYHPHVLSEAEQKETANRADQKLADAISWAASVQAQARRRELGKTTTGETPIGEKTITLSEDELNSFFQSWQNPDKSELQRRLKRYFSDGRVVLAQNEIILAGEAKGYGTLVSLHLQPSIDETGHLRLQWEGISAGMLPVPKSSVGGSLDKAQAALREQMAFWQRSADVDPTLTANAAAAEAGMSHLLLDALNDRASNPIFFVPFDLGDLQSSLAVRISGIQVEDGSITMTLQPLSAGDRAGVLQWIGQRDEQPSDPP